MLNRNAYGYKVEERRTDNYTPPPLDSAYAKRRQAERLLSRRRLRRGELAKYIGVSPRQASRILNELCIAIPLTEDEDCRWFVLGTEAERAHAV